MINSSNKNNMAREFLSVHDAHCCPKHGCKYGNEDCPVEAGKEPGITCETCDFETEIYPEELKNLTGMTPEEFEELKKDAQAYRNMKAEGKT